MENKGRQIEFILGGGAKDNNNEQKVTIPIGSKTTTAYHESVFSWEQPKRIVGPSNLYIIGKLLINCD